MTRHWYAYARHALVDAFVLAGVQPGDSVLLPRFICRDVLATLRRVGATPVWYDVPPTLVVTDSARWPSARAVLAVNYFGFAQALAPFRAYCDRTGAVLIEDNAHGWLSRDAHGSPLGERASLGITSTRKTIRSLDGAYLFVADGVHVNEAVALPGPLDVDDRPVPTGVRIRSVVARLARVTRLPLMNLMRAAVRLARRTAGRPPIPDTAYLEREMPPGRNIHRTSRALIAALDTDAEVRRRRRLYANVHERLRNGPGTPVFASLGDGTCPQGYPLIADDAQLPAIRRALRGTGLEVTTWPDLPSTATDVPDFYRHVRLVNFL
jgi:hypothetical protein